MTAAIPTVFIPALLCDEVLYRDVIGELGGLIEPLVMISPHPDLRDSVADILARAPATFVLVGTSYGGTLALAVALAAPERVRALWLMGCSAGAPASGGPDLAAGLRTTPDAVIAMLAGRVVYPKAAEAADAFRAMAARVGAAAGAMQATALATRGDLTARLGTLTMPALVLWGEDDALVPVATGRGLAAQLPHAHFHTLSACGHLPTLEKPDHAAQVFSEFLNTELHDGP